MSKKPFFTLILGIIIITISLIPLLIKNNEIPIQTFKTLTEDDIQIVFDVIINSNTPKIAPIVILLHGFMGNRKMMNRIALSLTYIGFIVVLVDFRGHGDSEGFILFSQNYEKDIMAVIRSLNAKNIGNTSEIIFLGHSLGGRVAVNLGSKLESAFATIGVAPYILPEMVTPLTPKNLLLIISKHDVIISNDNVIAAFYRSINSTGEPNKVYEVNDTKRMLIIDENTNHLSIIYNKHVINEIIKWVSNIGSDQKQFPTIQPDFINIDIILSVLGGFIIVGSLLVLYYNLLNKRKSRN